MAGFFQPRKNCFILTAEFGIFLEIFTYEDLVISRLFMSPTVRIAEPGITSIICSWGRIVKRLLAP